VDIVEEFPFRVVLRSQHKAVPIEFVLPSELENHFQPPEVICVVKGQGTDFENVVWLVMGDDYKSVNMQLAYTACSRARAKFQIFCCFDKKEDYDQFIIMSKIVKGHNPMRPKNREKELRHYLIRQYFLPILDQFYTIKEAYTAYCDNKGANFMKQKPVGYKQFVKDFNSIFYNHKFPEKPQHVMSIRGNKVAEKVLNSCVMTLYQDRDNRNIPQREKPLFKMVNNSNLADSKVQKYNTQLPTIYR
jgi:hypothetical protein